MNLANWLPFLSLFPTYSVIACFFSVQKDRKEIVFLKCLAHVEWSFLWGFWNHCLYLLSCSFILLRTLIKMR